MIIVTEHDAHVRVGLNMTNEDIDQMLSNKQTLRTSGEILHRICRR